jgi:PAS domain S-box-containing protein
MTTSVTAGIEPAWFGENMTDPHEALERLRAVLGHCPRSIAVVDRAGRLVGFNRTFARLFETPPSIGAQIGDFFDSPDREMLGQVTRSVQDDDRSAALLSVCTTHGREIEFLAATLPAADRELVGVVLAGEDCTDRRREEVEHAAIARTIARQNEIGAFNLAQATLVHDLANALAVAVLNVQALVAKSGAGAGAGSGHDPGGDALDALNHASGLVAGARRRARPGAREANERAEIRACALRVERLLRRTLPRGKVTLVCDVATDLQVAIGSTELMQVLTNLLSNAIHAVEDARRPGTVRLWAEVDGACARVHVRDDGVGIEPSHLQAAFDPYETTRAAVGGTGLGLAITQRLVEAAGGCIRVVSTPGEGSEFNVELPIDERVSSVA